MARPREGKAEAESRRLVVAQNRKARHEYFIEDTLEAGIALTGTEVKALRGGRSNVQDAYASSDAGDMWLLNCYIPEYAHGNRNNHEPRRARRLLLNRREINKLSGATQRDGYTVVPLSIYFNGRGRAKVELGLAKGKKQYDKRATIKERDWNREKQRLLKSGS
jgi:SsrA-binding protein